MHGENLARMARLAVRNSLIGTNCQSKSKQSYQKIVELKFNECQYFKK